MTLKVSKGNMTWNEAKENSDKLIKKIELLLEIEHPKSIKEVLSIVNKIDSDCRAVPNPNQEGQYCQLILYPSAKWKTWNQTSMSIFKYNLYN